MTTKMYWFCVATFVLGQVITLMLVTVPEMKKMSRAANKKFSLGAWWDCDWNLIIGTQAIGALFIFGLDQFLAWKPDVIYYVKWFFAGLGAFGSTVAMAKLSQFKKGITDLMDIKSNAADQIIGESKTVEEVKTNFENNTGKSSDEIEIKK